VAVEGDRTRVGVVETGDQLEDGRLAGTGLADERDGLVRRDSQVEPPEGLRRLAAYGVRTGGYDVRRAARLGGDLGLW
jgi:hypothetical protein